MTIRVAIADDQPLLVSAFEALLNAQPDIEVVAVATDGREAVELARQRCIDVMLMDIQMPGMDGVEATRLLTARGELPRVVVLTTFNVDELVIGAVRAGARGFLLKDADPADLLESIRTVHAGEAVIAPAAATHLLRDYRQKDTDLRPDPYVQRLLDRLTDRELNVFSLVAEGRTNPEIAAKLVIAETTVKTHIGRLLMKLECRDRVALVVLAHAAGLMS